MDPALNESEPEPEPRSGERRHYARMGHWGTAWISILPDGIKVIAYLIELGLGGCSVEADAAIPIELGACVDVLLSVDGLALQLAGVIRHLEENQCRAGIGFAAMSRRKAEQVHRLMEILMEAEKERLAGVKPLGG